MAGGARLAVRVRLFAIQRELAGTRELRAELHPGATLEDVWAEVVRRYPVLAPGRPSIRFARNGEYADAGERIADADEIAFIPPVSGGAADRHAGSDDRGDEIPALRRLELTGTPIDDAVLAALRTGVAHPRLGAIVEFLGITRETPGTPSPGEEAEAARHVDQPVLGLTYEAFEEMTLRVMDEIAAEVEARHGVRRLGIVHRVGEVPLGEASVAIAAGAPHRAEAFAACRYAIDELKARAPIWKSERFADGSVWIGQPARTAPGSG